MKKVRTIPTTYVVELTEKEIYHLVQRCKFADKLYNVVPDLSKPTWQELEKLLPQAVEYSPDLY